MHILMSVKTDLEGFVLVSPMVTLLVQKIILRLYLNVGLTISTMSF
jgi:hypothetical protein